MVSAVVAVLFAGLLHSCHQSLFCQATDNRQYSDYKIINWVDHIMEETNSCWVECIELENNSNISIINWVGHTTEKTKVYYIT